MKKLSLFIVLLMIMTPGIINAQLFAGGNIGFSTSGGKEDYGNGEQDKTSHLNLDVGPMMGFFLSDDFAAGARILVSIDRTKTPPYTPGDDETVNSETTMGFMPFIRYYVVHVNKFSVFGQAQGGIAFGKEKTKVGSTETDGPKTVAIAFGVIPGISYEAGDHVRLEAHINILSFAFSSVTEKYETEFVNTKETTRNFSFGVDADNIATTGAISVGAIILF